MMKFVLKYYIENQLSYNWLMKGFEKEVKIGKGKSFITLKVGKSAKESFRLIKGLKAIAVLTSTGSNGRGILVSRRRNVWRVEIEIDSYVWLGFYYGFFISYLKAKGLRLRSFCNREGWLFLLRELGELRLKGLSYDYYQWSSMWSVLIRMDSFPRKIGKVFFSGLKLRYIER